MKSDWLYLIRVLCVFTCLWHTWANQWKNYSLYDLCNSKIKLKLTTPLFWQIKSWVEFFKSLIVKTTLFNVNSRKKSSNPGTASKKSHQIFAMTRKVKLPHFNRVLWSKVKVNRPQEVHITAKWCHQSSCPCHICQSSSAASRRRAKSWSSWSSRPKTPTDYSACRTVPWRGGGRQSRAWRWGVACGAAGGAWGARATWTKYIFLNMI